MTDTEKSEGLRDLDAMTAAVRRYCAKYGALVFAVPDGMMVLDAECFDTKALDRHIRDAYNRSLSCP